jgi:chemotaxis protein CheX
MSDEERRATARPAQLALEPALTPAAAGRLLGLLQGMRGTDLVLDSAEVETLSTPCLQILLAAAKSWRRDGRSLRIVAPPAGLRATLRDAEIALADLEAKEARCG